MDGLTPVRGPDPGELFRNSVRPSGERTKRHGKPAKGHEEEETAIEGLEDAANVDPESVGPDADGHGIDLQA